MESAGQTGRLRKTENDGGAPNDAPPFIFQLYDNYMSHYTVIICYMSQLYDNYMTHYTVIIF